MLQTLTQRWWASTALWAAVIAVIIFGQQQVASMHAGHGAESDNPEGTRYDVSVRAEGKGGFTIRLPVHKTGKKEAVALGVNERPLKELNLEMEEDAGQSLVLAVLLMPNRRLLPADRKKIKWFMLGVNKFPADLGAALLPVASTRPRRFDPVYHNSNAYFDYSQAFPVVALPAADAPKCDSFKDYKQKWKAHRGLDERASRLSRPKNTRYAPEPVLFAGSDNLIPKAGWKAGIDYRASFLLWKPADGQSSDGQFVWTHWATARSNHGGELDFVTHPNIRFEPVAESPGETSDECPVCLEGLSVVNAVPAGAPLVQIKGRTGFSDKAAIWTPCRHLFHVHCLQGVFHEAVAGMRTFSCPICRRNLNSMVRA